MIAHFNSLSVEAMERRGRERRHGRFSLLLGITEPQEAADSRRKLQETAEFCRSPFVSMSLSLLILPCHGPSQVVSCMSGKSICHFDCGTFLGSLTLPLKFMFKGSQAMSWLKRQR